MNNIDELLLEYSIRTYIVRRVDWNKLACYFRFGRDWKKMKFICRLKIFFNMAAIYSKLFCCVQWVHICLQIKNLLNIRWIDEIQVKCSQWAFSGIMVDWAQRCSLTRDLRRVLPLPTCMTHIYTIYLHWSKTFKFFYWTIQKYTSTGF